MSKRWLVAGVVAFLLGLAGCGVSSGEVNGACAHHGGLAYVRYHNGESNEDETAIVQCRDGYVTVVQ